MKTEDINHHTIGSEPSKPSCEHSVAHKIIQRAVFGIAKYGVSVDNSTLPRIEWLRHLQEELMDAAVYIEKLIREEEK